MNAAPLASQLPESKSWATIRAAPRAFASSPPALAARMLCSRFMMQKRSVRERSRVLRSGPAYSERLVTLKTASGNGSQNRGYGKEGKKRAALE
jgi:hypothetical protein